MPWVGKFWKSLLRLLYGTTVLSGIVFIAISTVPVGWSQDCANLDTSINRNIEDAETSLKQSKCFSSKLDEILSDSNEEGEFDVFELLESANKWIKRNLYVFLSGSAIALLLLVMCIYLLWRTRPIAKSLDEAIELVKASEEKKWDYSDYVATDEKMKQNRYLGQAWIKFTELLSPVNGQKIRHSERLKDYINIEEAQGDIFHRLNFLEEFPSIFVNLGFAFTIIGLVFMVSLVDEARQNEETVTAKTGWEHRVANTLAKQEEETAAVKSRQDQRKDDISSEKTEETVTARSTKKTETENTSRSKQRTDTFATTTREIEAENTSHSNRRADTVAATTRIIKTKDTSITRPETQLLISAFGLLASILFSHFHRCRTYRLKIRFHSLCNELEKRMELSPQ